MKVKLPSRVRLFATSWTVAHQASPSMGFSKKEYWSGLPFPSPGDLLDPRIEPQSPALQADALPSEPPGKMTCIVSLRHFFFPVSIFWDFVLNRKLTQGKKCLRETIHVLNITCTKVSLICRRLSGKEPACQLRRHGFDP